MATLREAATWGHRAIEQAAVSESSRLDALVLLWHAAGISKEYFYAEAESQLDQNAFDRYRADVHRRCAAEPVAYIVQRREFYGLEFHVDRRVLIPRPESELLVERGLQHVDGLSPLIHPVRVLDMCTGSGCVGIALAYHRPGIEVTLADRSPEALCVASTNSRSLLGRQLETVETDLFDALPQRRFHLIVANPPYLAHTWFQEAAEQVKQEPQLALLGGGLDGLDLIRCLVQQAPSHLEPDGALMIECDGRQQENVALLLEKLGFTDVVAFDDLAGIGRIVVGRLACTKN